MITDSYGVHVSVSEMVYNDIRINVLITSSARLTQLQAPPDFKPPFHRLAQPNDIGHENECKTSAKPPPTLLSQSLANDPALLTKDSLLRVMNQICQICAEGTYATIHGMCSQSADVS